MNMKAALLKKFDQPLAVESVNVPEIDDSSVLVKVEAAGICHSDLHIWHGREFNKIPLILGHEGAGIVEKVGSAVKNVKPGDRVMLDYRLTCGQCYYCSSGRTNLCDNARDIGFDYDGAYAEYVTIPAREAFHLPSEISFDVGAVMACAVVTGYHATRISELRASDTVAIIGIGGIGYNILKFARLFGARKIIAVDVDDRKLSRASKLGAETINPKEGGGSIEKLVKGLTNGEGVDIAFEAIGRARTAEAAIRSLGKAGRAIQVGVCTETVTLTPWNDLMMNPATTNSGREVQIRSSIDHLRSEIFEVIELVRTRKIDLSDAVTHSVSLEDANSGLQMLESKTGDPMRIVIHPQER
jgi:threonine dehydrogenase-like Zn-dependent dehydrogenase